MKKITLILLMLLSVIQLNCGFISNDRNSDSPPVFILNPVNASVQAGREVMLSVKVSGKPYPSISWESSSDGVSWAVINGAAGESYTFVSVTADNGKFFRARAVNPRGESLSESSALKVVSDGLVNQVTSNGICWTFDREYLTGEFVTGDYWVAGPVTVVSVYPAPSEAGGVYHNGSMINPANGTQAYDSGTEHFGHPYKPEYAVKYPVTVEINSSLVSTVSVMPTAEDPYPRPSLKAASVLTVLSEPPAAGTFRPGLIGSEKKLYNVSSINWGILPSLAPEVKIPDASVIAEEYTKRLKRPWLLHGTGWLHRHIMPEENSPSYHRDVAMLLDEAAVLCITGWGDRTELVINYIQVAIDYYTMQRNGKTTGIQGAYNYRWPVIFAGIMLGDNDMRDLWLNNNQSTPSYHQGALYYWENQARTRHSAIVPAGDTWTGYHARTGKRAVFYSIVDLTQPDVGGHEELAPSEWFTLISETDYPGGGLKQEGYRQMHSASIPGFALAAYAFNAVSYMNFPEYFDYADRWMTETEAVITASGGELMVPYSVQTSYSSFVDEMWFKYRGDY